MFSPRPSGGYRVMNSLMQNQVQNKKTQNILFVDDDENIRKGVLRLFRQYQVPWAYSFAQGVDEALDILQEHDVDAVVADICMPGRDGFELLAFLRGHHRWSDLPVVMITGLDNPGLKSKALDMGATDLLNKPVTPDDLLARIRSVLYIKHCQDIIKSQNAHLEELVHQRTKALEATRLDMIWRLGKAAEFRSNETGNHVIRVGYYSKILADRLEIGKDFSEMIFLTSPLHDLGKIGIPDSILLKPGSLTDSEWVTMKTHCQIGQELLNADTFKRDNSFVTIGLSIDDILNKERNPFLHMAAAIAESHHEQWNGGGYPFGKRHEAIPLAARIVCISDVYDALRSKRTYKPEIAHAEAVAIMRNENTSRFDPEIFSAFERSFKEFEDVHVQYGDECL
jgi:putative two-component system response regulator